MPLLVLAGLALTPLYPVPEFQPPPPGENTALAYDEVFPYYLEYAAMTRIKRSGQNPGGRHGHAAFYLKGVRRVEGTPYPRLELVPEGVDLTDPEVGVGVSVNKIFKNVNWVAFDGADLFYAGGLGRGDIIDAGARDAAIDLAVRAGVFAGVEVHDWVLADKPSELGLERHIGRSSVGTDFALRFGRDIACVRVPVTREMMRRMVSYLNAMNARFAEDPARSFEWSGVGNNCTHLAVNALAEVSNVRRLETDAGRFRRLFNLAIPANVFVDLAVAGNRPPRADEAIAGGTLHDYEWLLGQPGVVVRFLPRFRNNELWEGDFDFYTMERPVVPLILVPPLQVIPIGSKWIWPPFYRFEQKAFRRLFRESRYHDLAANMAYFSDFYGEELSRVEKQRPKTAGGRDGGETNWNRYRNYVEGQLRKLEAAAARGRSEAP